MIRAPICAVVGHVDHGKTTLLDTLRGTAVAAGEAGAITQAIGASIIPIEHIQKNASHLLGKQKISIPGLLFIDTPGHAAFTGMRKRGGSLADIAILVVDMNEGFKPQTMEAIEILKTYKTPFVIAANKLDLTPNYYKKTGFVIDDINQQQPLVIDYIEKKLYEIVGKVAEVGIQSERFDRISNFEEQIAIVPISAQKGLGIDSLLAVLVGLAQKYLEKNLEASAEGPAKGTVLEVGEEQGMGRTIDAIIYDGKLDVGDTIVVGTIRKPVITKVRALFLPAPLSEMRDKKTRFVSIQKAVAATGVKISAPDIEEVIAGMPFEEAGGRVEEVQRAIEAEIQEVSIETEQEGVIIKADNMGSLEALIQLLQTKNVRIRSAHVGPITKKDLTRAASNPPEHAIILAFNVPKEHEKMEGVTIIHANIIYQLLDEYEKYRHTIEQQQKSDLLKKLVRPCKIRVLQNCIFRQSNPLICGIEVTEGTLKQGMKLAKDNDIEQIIGTVKEIQDNKETIPEAKKGDQIALSIPGAVGERHVHEGDVLWGAINEEEFRLLKQHSKELTHDEKTLLKEYAEKKREKNPVWGV